jgi:hypothetical protein
VPAQQQSSSSAFVSVSRKCLVKSGTDVFSRSQEIWGCGIYVGPENLDQMYFYVPRKSGRVVFTLVQKIWTSCFSRSQEIWGSGIYTGTENLDQLYFSPSQEIWVCGIYVGPENLDQLHFSPSQEIWVSGIYVGPENLDLFYLHVPRKSIRRPRFSFCFSRSIPFVNH